MRKESRGRGEQKWMDHLAIVRHGESQRNVGKDEAVKAGQMDYGGGLRDMDVALTRRGEQQAEATGAFLSRRFQFDRLFVSPYLRTIQTAELLAKLLAHPPRITVEERIREKEFGILDGLTKVGIQKKYPEEWNRRARDGKYYYRPPGGESYPDVALRVHSFLGTLLRDCRRQSVLVVCHSVVVLTFRRLMERLTEKELLEIDRDPEHDVCNCSLTRYCYHARAGERGRMVLEEFNGVHYAAEFASTKECAKKARVGH
ncbi:MAG: histidine phosphatase family protein [Acidobacteria bacterium]|nr:MAG: histidine phosphatase family protein [Acidobacteriota bacterium]